MTFSASQLLPRFLGTPSRPFLEKTEVPMKLTETSIKKLSLTDGKTDGQAVYVGTAFKF